MTCGPYDVADGGVVWRWDLRDFAICAPDRSDTLLRDVMQNRVLIGGAREPRHRPLRGQQQPQRPGERIADGKAGVVELVDEVRPAAQRLDDRRPGGVLGYLHASIRA